MNLRFCAFLLLAVGMIVSFQFPAHAKHKDFPRLPGAELLTGYPGDDLAITTPSSTLILQKGHNSKSVLPSMSRDGGIIAASQWRRDISRSIFTLALATYSVPDKQWREYATLESRIQCLFMGGQNSNNDRLFAIAASNTLSLKRFLAAARNSQKIKWTLPRYAN